MRTLGSAGVLIAVAGAAWAQELPRYDPAPGCKRFADAGGTYSEQVYALCLAQEQDAYDKFKRSGPEIPTPIRERCDQLGSAGGDGGSYRVLQLCLQREQSVP
jgi:hypothetical protein